MTHAHSVIHAWASTDNKESPHAALGYQTPKAFAGSLFAATGSHVVPETNSAQLPLGRRAPQGLSTQRSLVPNGEKFGTHVTSYPAIHLTLLDLSLATLDIVSHWPQAQSCSGQGWTDNWHMRPARF